MGDMHLRSHLERGALQDHFGGQPNSGRRHDRGHSPHGPAALLGPPRTALRVLRELHSGHIGDYIAWWTAAAAALGGASLILLT
jgi:hypothetical protein